MKLYKTIYLANPQDKMDAHGYTKWEVVFADGFTVGELGVNFISGDSLDIDKNWRTDKNWVLASGCIPDWDNMCEAGRLLAYTTIEKQVIKNIKLCDALILYLDSPCKNTATLEVTYASTIGKPCYIIVNSYGVHTFGISKQIPRITYTNEDIYTTENGKEYIKSKFGKIQESIWAITGLPNVYILDVDNIEDAKDTVRKLLLVESPIEALLLQEIATQYERNFYAPSYGLEKKDVFYTLADIEPQFEVAGYRIDFAYPDKKLAVELDGHDYHKTKEQRKYDAKRDRALSLEGWNVIRFTGSEVYQNAQKCVDEIENHLGMGRKLKTFREIAQRRVENGQN